jgi:hypothetical protein
LRTGVSSNSKKELNPLSSPQGCAQDAGIAQNARDG